MNAAQLNQQKDYPNFPELSAIDLSLTDARTILTLQAIRTQGGFPIFPGLQQSNWGRTWGSEKSEHFGVDRLSTAGDVFPARGHVMRFWTLCQEQAAVGGIGLYLDTRRNGRPWLMVHLDLRPRPRMMWVRDEAGNYWSDNRNPIQFWGCVRSAIARDVL